MKTLPKYFIILRDATNPLWDKYIQWLNKTYCDPIREERWEGTIEKNYYGYDNNNMFDSKTNSYLNPEGFINNPTIITLDYWNECVNGFQLPEKWCVRHYQEVANYIIELIGNNNGNYYEDLTKYSHFPPINPISGGNDGRCFNNIQKGYTEITFEQFTKYVLKQDNMEKKLIGYKLIKPEMYKTASIIIHSNDAGSTQLDTIISSPRESLWIDKLKEAGVLDLWFEPVYEDLLESKVKEFTAKTGIEVGSTIVAPNTISGEICWDSSYVKWRTTTAHGNREVTKFILHSDGTTLLMQVNGTTSDVWFNAYKMKLVNSTPSITIKGYKAEFTEDYVTFGCQTYSKEFVLTLAECLRKNRFAMEHDVEIIEIAEYFESL